MVQFNNTSVTPITTDRSFAFQIDDGGVVNNLATATATVTIGTVNHAPTTADTSASGAEDGGAIAIVLSGNDIDGTVASFAITSLPTNGTLSTDAAGLNPVALNQLITASGNAATLYFTPAANFNGAPSFQYAAIDNNGAQDATPATATINITAVDDAPVATITPTSYGPVNEQTSLTLHGTGLSISDVDAGSGSLTVTLSVTEGTLNVTGGSTGAGVSASGSSLVTITGTQTQINNLLAGNGGATVTYLDNTEHAIGDCDADADGERQRPHRYWRSVVGERRRQQRGERDAVGTAGTLTLGNTAGITIVAERWQLVCDAHRHGRIDQCRARRSRLFAIGDGG